MRKRNKFNLSHTHLLTCDMGNLIPISCIEAIPGDTIKLNSIAFIRMAPLVAPTMHQIRVRIHHFFVPMRLLWDNWEEYITGVNVGTLPKITIPVANNNDRVCSLSDYFGIPIDNKESLEVNALPFRAYNLIYNEFYRDQDLIEPIYFYDGDTSEEETLQNYTLQKVAWNKDYFTTARPWAQKGPAISVPIQTSGEPLKFQAEKGQTSGVTNPFELVYRATSGGNSANYWENDGIWPVKPGTTETAFNSGPYSGPLKLYGSEGMNINIHDLRLALGLQRFEEARANYGSRYIEYLRYAFGVKSSDARLQRPEYLGGGSSLFRIGEVLGTGENNLADLGGQGINVSKTNNCVRFFEEFGYVISLMSIVPKSIYTQGLNKMWIKSSSNDFYNKDLANLGMEELMNSEVATLDTDVNESTVFGYQNRYDSYRYEPSRISGEFRTDALDEWHLGRRFDNQPVLNKDFIECNPSKRIFASPSTNGFYCMIANNIRARRVLSLFSKPKTF